MTRAAIAAERLPYWPRFLGRDMAAAFVGVSPNVFDSEVSKGKWPAGIPRGERGGKLTWDRRALEMIADAALGVSDGVDDYEVAISRSAARRQRNTKAS